MKGNGDKQKFYLKTFKHKTNGTRIRQVAVVGDLGVTSKVVGNDDKRIDDKSDKNDKRDDKNNDKGVNSKKRVFERSVDRINRKDDNIDII